jgi:hypothetical protein
MSQNLLFLTSDVICDDSHMLQHILQISGLDTQGIMDDRQQNSNIPTENKVRAWSSLLLEYDFMFCAH